jgi:hypothetical protein
MPDALLHSSKLARLASEHPVSSTGQAFEQPPKQGVFQQPPLFIISSFYFL